jgi:hypothetical protein
MIASRQRRKHESKTISIVGNSYQTTTGDGIEDVMGAAVE